MTDTTRIGTKKTDARDARNLGDLLAHLAECSQGDGRVTMGEIVDAVGKRTFGPLLLLAGLVILMPLVGDIPGVPTVMAIFVALTAGQLLFRRNHLWIPGWMLRQSVSAQKLRSALDLMQKPARYIDRVLRPRLEVLVGNGANFLIAGTCILIAAIVPIMEFIPFSANLAGAALTAFGLSLVAKDGLVALIAFVISLSILGVLLFNLPG